MNNDRAMTLLGVDKLRLDPPIERVYSAGKGVPCMMCGERIATAVLDVVECPLARSVVVLLPCGCIPRMQSRLTPDAITALMLAL